MRHPLMKWIFPDPYRDELEERISKMRERDLEEQVERLTKELKYYESLYHELWEAIWLMPHNRKRLDEAQELAYQEWLETGDATSPGQSHPRRAEERLKRKANK